MDIKVHNHFPPLEEEVRAELFEAPVVVPFVLLTNRGWFLKFNKGIRGSPSGRGAHRTWGGRT